MPETPRNLRCSFCNRSETEVAQLVAGPRVFICDACVAIAADIIDHSKRPPTPTAPRLRRWIERAWTFLFPGGRGQQRSVAPGLS